MERTDYWRLPEDLGKLHDEIITYAVRIQQAAAANHEKRLDFPLSYTALYTLHGRAILVHRSIRALCQSGWTPSTPVLIRTLLDIIASCYAIAAKPEDAEYMGFKFLASYLIQATRDPETADAIRESSRENLERLREQLRGQDPVRADELIKNYVQRSYWYQPEFQSPGTILKTAKNDLYFIYRQFSGAAHGGFLGSLLFNDSPDTPDIDPHEHPRRTRDAIVMSSRLLLDISYLRGQFEGVTTVAKYHQVLAELILPQKELCNAI